MERLNRHAALLVALAACTKTRAEPDAAADVVVDPVAALPPPSAATPPVDPMLGEWERKTEPYAGMRIEIRDGKGVVTAAPAGTDDKTKCQRSLWKIGEEMLSGIHGRDATILVRDWGLVGGQCIHKDSRAAAEIAIDGDMTISVTRGKTVTQRWSRVR
jgi:hypothetical protein